MALRPSDFFAEESISDVLIKSEAAKGQRAATEAQTLANVRTKTEIDAQSQLGLSDMGEEERAKYKSPEELKSAGYERFQRKEAEKRQALSTMQVAAQAMVIEEQINAGVQRIYRSMRGKPKNEVTSAINSYLNQPEIQQLSSVIGRTNDVYQVIGADQGIIQQTAAVQPGQKLTLKRADGTMTTLEGGEGGTIYTYMTGTEDGLMVGDVIKNTQDGLDRKLLKAQINEAKSKASKIGDIPGLDQFVTGMLDLIQDNNKAQEDILNSEADDEEKNMRLAQLKLNNAAIFNIIDQAMKGNMNADQVVAYQQEQKLNSSVTLDNATLSKIASANNVSVSELLSKLIKSNIVKDEDARKFLQKDSDHSIDTGMTPNQIQDLLKGKKTSRVKVIDETMKATETRLKNKSFGAL